MQFIINCRNRTLFLSSLTIFLILLTYILCPWLYIHWLWRKSDINHLDFSFASKLNESRVYVPGIIHQTWRDADTVPLDWQQASNSCRSLHPNYQYRLWTNADGRELIEKEFPCLLSTYDSYSYDIQRADVIRLIVLYVFGGIYLDLDIICLKPLDQLRTYNFVLPKTMPVGLSNDVIIATPKHPLLLQVLNDLPKYNKNYFTKYATVMFSTGPMFLTYEASSYHHLFPVNVLSQELYGKYVHNSSLSLFRHLKASSWHGNDAAFVKWIYRQRTKLSFVLIVLSFVMIVFVYFIRRRRISVNSFKSILFKLKFNRDSVPYDKMNSDIIFI